MTNNLVFIGNYGNRNIGDDAILQMLSDRYHDALPAYQQYVFVRHYAEDVLRISHAQPLCITLRTLLWVLLQGHMIVIGGGGLFGAHMGPAARFIPLFALVCRLLGKQIIYDSIGIYSNTPWIQQLLLSLSLLTAQSVSVRDATSWKMTRYLRRLRRIALVEDPGFTIQPIARQAALDVLRQEGIIIEEDATIIGLSVKRVIRDVAKTQQMSHSLIACCQWLIDHGYTLLFLPFCHDPDKWSEQDVAFAQELMAHLHAPNAVFCVTTYLTPREVAGIVKLTSAFIGMRFHAQVFAHALHVPLLPIAYEEKRLDFIKKYHYPIIPIDSLSDNTFIAHVERVVPHKMVSFT